MQQLYEWPGCLSALPWITTGRPNGENNASSTKNRNRNPGVRVKDDWTRPYFDAAHRMTVTDQIRKPLPKLPATKQNAAREIQP